MNNQVVGIRTVAGEAAKNAIMKFKCMLIPQIRYFLPEHTMQYKDDKSMAICKYLSKEKYVTMDENYIYSRGNSLMDVNMVDCIWAMIDMLEPENKDDIPLSEALKQAFILERPESLCFIRKNTEIIRVMAVETEAEIPLIAFTQEKILQLKEVQPGHEHEIEDILLIVIRNENMLNKISNINIKIPHKIAYLEGGMLEKPKVYYYGN